MAENIFKNQTVFLAHGSLYLVKSSEISWDQPIPIDFQEFHFGPRIIAAFLHDSNGLWEATPSKAPGSTNTH